MKKSFFIFSTLFISLFSIFLFSQKSEAQTRARLRYLTWPGQWIYGNVPMASNSRYLLTNSPIYISSLLNNNNVGIGTIAPDAKLDVAGTVHLRGAAGRIGLYVDSTGSVGIGTTTPRPAFKLDVNGYINGEGICIGNDCRNSWSVISMIEPKIVSNYSRANDSWFSVYVECPSNWIRTGCSFYQEQCPKGECGVYGVIPDGLNGCRAYFDGWGNILNSVYAYCIRLR